MKKLASVIILYNPSFDTFYNILTYIELVDILYVVDNSEIINLQLVRTLKAMDKVVYIKNNENNGIAKTLNSVLSLVDDEFEFLLTMDQDSAFTKNSIERYMEHIQNFCVGEDKNFWGFAPITENDYKDFEKIKKPIDSCCRKITACITSGQIVSVQIVKKLGGWNEELFIDEVDSEICYRAAENGYLLYQFTDIILKHKLGEPIKKKLFGFWKIESSNHNYIRLYYIVRNMLYVRKKYGKKYTKNYLHSIKKRVVKMLFIENDRLRKCKSIYNAIIDYRNNDMGKKEFVD